MKYSFDMKGLVSLGNKVSLDGKWEEIIIHFRFQAFPNFVLVDSGWLWEIAPS